MKKLIVTIAIVLGLTAQVDENMYETKGGLFGLGQNIFTNADEEMLMPYGYEDAETFIPEAYSSMDDNGSAGLFGLGNSGLYNGTRDGSLINLPGTHGAEDDQQGPLGSGIAVLTALGAAYLVGKRRKE